VAVGGPEMRLLLSLNPGFQAHLRYLFNAKRADGRQLVNENR
jgi:hypothetical protein